MRRATITVREMRPEDALVYLQVIDSAIRTAGRGYPCDRRVPASWQRHEQATATIARDHLRPCAEYPAGPLSKG